MLEGFLKSAEMANLCDAAGIEQGIFLSNKIADRNYPVTTFVSRLYRLVLNRKPDAEGLEYWLNALLVTKEKTALDVARNFFESEEWQKRKSSDEEFVTAAYNALLGREPDRKGFNYWMIALDEGASRGSVLERFLSSDEFKDLCGRYGI